MVEWKTGVTMYGVVLWSDRKQACAVIWCEDHSKLAYFKEESVGAQKAVTFNPGDLVEFDIREENEMRFAVAPSVVAAREFPSLPDDLKRASAPFETARTTTSLPGGEDSRSAVVMFPQMVETVDRDLGHGEGVGRRYG